MFSSPPAEEPSAYVGTDCASALAGIIAASAISSAATYMLFFIVSPFALSALILFQVFASSLRRKSGIESTGPTLEKTVHRLGSLAHRAGPVSVRADRTINRQSPKASERGTMEQW